MVSYPISLLLATISIILPVYSVSLKVDSFDTTSTLFIGDECLQLESLYNPDIYGIIYADVVIDRNSLGNHTCLVSTKVEKVEGNIEIGPSIYIDNVVLSGLKVVVGSLAILGLMNDHYEPNSKSYRETSLTFRADDLTEVHEFLQIRYNGLNTIELPSLKFVGRTLELKDNLHLEKFDFPVLQEVGLHLVIQDNPNLIQITLPKLERIRWDLWVQYNTHLVAIDTPKLTYIGEDYELHYCGELMIIDHPQLEWIGEDFEIYATINLKELHLPKLEYIGEDFEVDNSPRLETINLPELRRIDEDFTLSSLPNLQQLIMSKLGEIGEDFEFIMVGLPEIYLPSLHLVESDTLISDMPNLQLIELPKIVIMEGALELNGCPQLKIFDLPVEVIGSNPNKERKEIYGERRRMNGKGKGGKGKGGNVRWQEDSCGESSKQGNGLYGGWKPNPKYVGWKHSGWKKSKSKYVDRKKTKSRKLTYVSDKEEKAQQEAEIDQRFYITGCDVLEDITLYNLRKITADTMLIFGLPNLERVLLPNLSSYKVEEDDPDGLELFAIATNPKLNTIVLPTYLNQPKLYSFIGNKTPNPTIGPKWAFSGDGVTLPDLKEFIYESLCPNDDDHHTESDFERQFCIDYNCPEEAKSIENEGLSQYIGDCISLIDLYDVLADGTIDGSVTISHSDLSCITCDNITKVLGCIKISNNENLRKISCGSLESIEGSLIIRNNPKLIELDIENIRDLGGIGLYVVANSMKDISLPNLIYTNTIHIASNFYLEYAYFNSLNHTSQHLHFITNPSLKEINVPYLQVIGDGEDLVGDLHLQGNTAMINYNFPNLESVGEDVEIYYSPYLDNIYFPNLRIVEEDFELYYFLKLKEVTIHKLESVGEDVEIWDLPSVRIISLPKLLEVGEDFEVFDCLLLENLSIPSLDTVEEDFDFYVNREVKFLHAPKLKHIWEDIQLFGNDHLMEVSFPELHDIARGEGGGFLITTNRMLQKLEFPSLVMLGKNRGDNGLSTDASGDFGYCYPGRDGDEALFLYSAIHSTSPFIVNRNRPFMICDNASLISIDIPNLHTLDSGGFLIEAQPQLKSVNVSALNELGKLTYFIIRHNPKLGNEALSIGDLSAGNSGNDPILSNLQCNSPDFCILLVDDSTKIPKWLQHEVCHPTVSNNNSCPNTTTYPNTQMCDSKSTCTDAYYLWARENDYDFEENVVQLSAPPQYSAVEWKRRQRCINGCSTSSSSGKGSSKSSVKSRSSKVPKYDKSSKIPNYGKSTKSPKWKSSSKNPTIKQGKTVKARSKQDNNNDTDGSLLLI